MYLDECKGFLESWMLKELMPRTNQIPQNSGSHLHNNPACSMSEESLSIGSKEVDEVEKSLHYLSYQIDNVVQMFTDNREFPSDSQLPEASVRLVS